MRLSTGPLELKAGSSPVGRFIGVILVCAFWNGIVGVFVSGMIAGWTRGHPDYFLTVFLVPFLLVGLFLLWLSIHTFLAIFNPRPVLQINSSCVPLGGEFNVRWRLNGNANKLTSFRVTLEGREEATYTRGTNTYTDRTVFHSQVFIEASTQFGFGGEGRVRVPKESMCSFHSSSNKVVWALKAHGEIPRWPDVEEEYQIEVLPLPLTEFGRS